MKIAIYFLTCAALTFANLAWAQNIDYSASDYAYSSALAGCSELPRGVKVQPKSAKCGRKPAVVLSGSWKNIFSAAFRWDDGSSEGQDRSPFALDDGSASSSPYKAQKRIRGSKQDILCFGSFVGSSRFPAPTQLTIKRTPAPSVNRFCVAF